MSGDGHGFRAQTFRVAGAKGKEDAVPKGHDGFLHGLLLVVTVGDPAAGFEQIRLESFGEEGERHDAVGNPKGAALVSRTGKFAGVVFSAVVETEGGHHLLRGSHMVEDGDGVEPARKQDNDLHGKKGFLAFS